MINITPFKAVRPPRDKANLVASRPFYNYKKHILMARLEGNPFTFLHVINPEFGTNDKTKPNSAERFEKVREKYNDFVSDKTLIKDEIEAFYIYQQATPTNTYIGIIAGADVNDYIEGKIKIHEHTLTEREKTFCKYIDICRFNAEPVLLTYEDDLDINNIIDSYSKTRSEYEFTTTDLIKHDLWVVDNKEDINTLKKAFENVKAVYIADGHHRTSSSVLYAQDNPENEDAQYFLSYFIAESKLKIYDFNRTIKGLNDLDKETFLTKVETFFNVSKIDSSNVSPEEIHQFSMYLEGDWYRLTTKPEFIKTDSPVGNLDPEILSQTILSKILGIKDLKNDKRAGFIDGTKGMEALKNSVDSGKSTVAFALYPISIEQLKLIADTNNIMPPKSTWIEPKMRSGLTIYEF